VVFVLFAKEPAFSSAGVACLSTFLVIAENVVLIAILRKESVTSSSLKVESFVREY
jgi:hypothetical protein